MPSADSSRRRPGKKGLILRKLDEWRPERIGEAEFRLLLATLAPLSESWARKVLRQTGIPLAPMVEGVRQDSLESLDRTLLNLLDEYETAQQAGDSRRQHEIRRLVILAKDHAKMAARAAQGTRQRDKIEMVLRMLTWLENPGVFRQWIRLRNATLPPKRPPGIESDIP